MEGEAEPAGADHAIAGGVRGLARPAEAGTYIVYCKPHTFEPEDPSGEDMAADLTIR